MLQLLKIVLTVLRICDTIITFARERGLINEGYDKALAEIAGNVLRKSAYAKQIMYHISKLSDSDTDKLLRQLEPNK